MTDARGTGSPIALPASDPERFEVVREHLFTAVVGDILDALGRSHQYLPPDIRPLDPEMTIVGRAMPVLIADVFGAPARPFGRLTDALDDLRPGEVYLARGGRLDCAAWGELLTVTARARGAVGAVLDGRHRDTRAVLGQGWPVFSRGAYGRDARIRSSVVDYRVPIEIGTVQVTPGDLVIADLDGVLLVPAELEDEVLGRALEKASTENLVRAAIERGMSSTEAFATYGVL